jgi:hypothetical protein
VGAQSNPDFSNVNDILHGNRALIQMTDLQVVGFQPPSGYRLGSYCFYSFATNNSHLTKIVPPYNDDCGWQPNNTGFQTPLHLFSGWMINEPTAVTIAAQDAV